VGRVLARRLGVGFTDIDALIVERIGKPIADMFTEDGEDAFRALEREVVAEALGATDGVLALGGGSVLAATTRERLRGHRVVLLWVGLADGLRRTGMSTARPLLAGVNPRATFKALLDARAPLYREVATVEVDTSRRSANQVARAVLSEVAQAHPGVVPPEVLEAVAGEATPAHGTPRTDAAAADEPAGTSPHRAGTPVDPLDVPTPVAAVPLPDPLVRPHP
jgi:shikimate kinase